jgi:hypothetical protein
MKVFQGKVLRQNLSIMALMAIRGAVNAGFTGMGNLFDGGMTFRAAELAMRRVEKFFFVDMEHLESVCFLMPHQSRILVTR